MTLAHASAPDTVRVLVDVVAPTVARGLIQRWPPMVRMADRLQADRRAVRRLQWLRARYGDGPVVLAVPGRRFAIVLSPHDVHRVLQGSPAPFSPATREKRAALERFQPHGVLISTGTQRDDRRRFNEAVLDTPHPVHQLADDLLATVRQETDAISAAVEVSGHLDWRAFADGWWRMVRRVVLGDGAAGDVELTDLLQRLRTQANWAVLGPTRRRLRERFERRLLDHLARPEPGSLARRVADTPATAVTLPHQQVPQWLFAFDAAGMATYRALALLSAASDHTDRIRAGLADTDPTVPQELPALRACLLESVRLWPTTPIILRDTTTETEWDTGRMPAGTGVVIHVPFFHRDDQRLAEADRFAPELWSRARTPDDWPLVPFSAGPAVCAGQPLVLLLASSMLAQLLSRHRFALPPGRLDDPDHLPATLDPFDLAFTVTTA